MQRRLSLLPRAFADFTRRTRRAHGAAAHGRRDSGLTDDGEGLAEDPEAVVFVGEHNCWPWPQPGLEKAMGTRRPRGVSMGYMRNTSFTIVQDEPAPTDGGELLAGGFGRVAGAPRRGTAVVRGDGVCAALRRRASTGRWHFPNSGAYLTTVRGGRALLERLRQLVLRGHFEDQGMAGLALLQHPSRALVVDANATLLSSQYGYNANWWARPACFTDYFDAAGEPPPQLETGNAPFAMHFNGPAGRHRLGWCVATFLRHCRRPLQYYVDLDADVHGGARVILPAYCDSDAAAATTAAAKGAEVPTGHEAAAPATQCATPTQPRVRCINDRCLTFKSA